MKLLLLSRTENGEPTFSVISTLHLSSTVFVDPKTFMNNFNRDGNYFMPSKLFAHDHNHPANTLPSGYIIRNGKIIPQPSFVNGSRGLVDYHNTVDNSFNGVKFRVYTRGKYINYDSNGGNE
ncbi:hypothetical protein [Frigoriflavimonas asaccharolytica]|uniref:Uncharacterized protein n=1 Tax=Frigoriflavimonas asaccharolytica TaxID=2735899 RepID=A0A8J8GBH9_9FLAO|nr:hypothetical protein [Frigoriflavimonas asaccharolytica]NRS94190.1 hypothetical protein [Frigoriflavimonas asaccharolytica]